MLGWVTGPASPTAAVPYWASAHSLPRELTLQPPDLLQHPAAELATLRRSHAALAPPELPLLVAAGAPRRLDAVRGFSGDSIEVVARWSLARGTNATAFGLRVRAAPVNASQPSAGEAAPTATEIRYEPATRALTATGARGVTQVPPAGTGHRHGTEAAPASPASQKPQGEKHVAMRVFVDRSVIETYVGGAALTVRAFPADPAAAVGIEVFAEGGTAVLSALDCWQIGSMWPGA